MVAVFAVQQFTVGFLLQHNILGLMSVTEKSNKTCSA